MKLTRLFFLFLSTSISVAQWSTDPSNNLIVAYGLLPELCSDSAGGAYITYEVSTVYPRHIALRRLNRYGYQPWGSSRAIQGVWPESHRAHIAEDGHNGVLIGFTDIIQTGPFSSLARGRVQRVDSSGNLLWGSSGVRVTVSETNHGVYALVSDGQGGCIVAWVDTLDALRVNRIDSSGTRRWGDSGVVIVQSTQYIPKLVRAESDKFVVAFGATLKKIDIHGNLLWGGNAVNVGFGTRSIISDNSGGVIVYDGTGTSSNVLVVTQRIDSSGAFVWNNPYVVLDDSSIFNVQGNPVVVNEDGGATFAWGKRVRPNVVRTFGQRVRADGTFVFADTGIQVSAVDSGRNGTWAIVTSLDDSKIFVNADGRYNGSILAQRIDSTGSRLWDSNDVAISLRQLGYVKVICDYDGGVIVVGFYQSDFSIRAQQCSRNGILGEVITSIDERISTDLIPSSFSLHQNYPNPFNARTLIRFDIPHSTRITLEIFNVLGQRVRTLVDGHYQAGSYQVPFEAGDLASGMYLYKLRTPETLQVHKLIIIK